MSIPADSIFAWTDSSTVLSSLKRPAFKQPVYVTHHINYFIFKTPAKQWRYVGTTHNPADLLSRGVLPSDLLHDELWWKGPPWLVLSPAEWPRRPDLNRGNELPSIAPIVLRAQPLHTEEEFGVTCSKLGKLRRAVAWMLRFYCRVRFKDKSHKTLSLTIPELRASTAFLLRVSQRQALSKEISSLKAAGVLQVKHPLSGLSPFLDSQGDLRVGGRLQQAGLSYSNTHPLILSGKAHITALLVQETHILTLHAGPSTMLAVLMPTYHIVGLKRLLRKISRSCVVCQRAYARTTKQLIGELPQARLQPARPFSIVGVDFAGPFRLKYGNPRRPTVSKCYVSVFICFVSRATHLELVSDMTTSAFIATLDRFTARRGLPAEIFSDNGSNFLGARSELQDIYHLIRSSAKDTIVNWAAAKGIQWHFSPGRAPHFGGLWEAAVRSMKILLRKVIGAHTLKWDEFLTVLTSAEATLNSRPLIPLESPPPDGIAPLTPGHFLIGGPLWSLPVNTNSSAKITSLRRWNLTQRLTAELWQRWKAEYLSQLQKRAKWKRPTTNLKSGDVVVLKDDDYFHRSWPMGRISSVFPGPDGHVRAVDVFLHGKTYRRPAHKVVRLLEDEAQDATSPRGEYVRAQNSSPTSSQNCTQ